MDMNWEGVGKAKSLIIRKQQELTTFSVSVPVFFFSLGIFADTEYVF